MKKPVIRFTLTTFKFVTLNGYIRAEGTATKLYLPPTNTQEELSLTNVDLVVDVRQRNIKKGPYTPGGMTGGVTGKYAITGFYDPGQTKSKCARRVICMKEGVITFFNGSKYTYYQLPTDTKIVAVSL